MQLRSKALQEARLAPDPFDVALSFVDAPLEEVLPLLAQRRMALASMLDQMVSERERLETAGVLPQLSGLVFRHGETRLSRSNEPNARRSNGDGTNPIQGDPRLRLQSAIRGG